MITVSVINYIDVKPRPGETIVHYASCLNQTYNLGVSSVKINGEIVPFQKWASRKFKEGDSVEITTN